MKLDFACMRDILLTLESMLQPDKSGNMKPVRVSELCEAMNESPFSDGIIAAHVRYLFEMGALKPGSLYVDADIEDIDDISYPDGYALLENLRKPDAVEVLYKVFTHVMPNNVAEIINEFNKTKAYLLEK